MSENPGLPDPPDAGDTDICFKKRKIYGVPDGFYLDGVESCCSTDCCCPHYCFCPPRTSEEEAEIEANRQEAHAMVLKYMAESFE